MPTHRTGRIPTPIIYSRVFFTELGYVDNMCMQYKISTMKFACLRPSLCFFVLLLPPLVHLIFVHISPITTKLPAGLALKTKPTPKPSHKLHPCSHTNIHFGHLEPLAHVEVTHV